MPDRDLSEALREYLRDWRDDLNLPWRAVLANTEPAFEDVREDLVLRETEFIYPARKGQALPGAAAGAHVFRALDRVEPANVHAVVIGQDPYPRVSRATGRAFEQGDLRAWTGAGNTVATSLKRLLQITAYQRTNDATFLAEGAGWQKVAAQLAAGTLTLEAPAALFNRWEDRGVIFLNAGLTISHYAQGGAPEQAYGHIPLWRPVIQRIFHHLVTRPQGRVVFLTWGAFARKVLKDSGVDKLPEWGTKADAATYAHPATPAFLQPPNPFAQANAVLSRIGGTQIDW